MVLLVVLVLKSTGCRARSTNIKYQTVFCRLVATKEYYLVKLTMKLTRLDCKFAANKLLGVYYEAFLKT